MRGSEATSRRSGFCRRSWHGAGKSYKRQFIVVATSQPICSSIVCEFGAKEVRYAAELSTPVIGKAAARTSRSAARVQTVLGEHHDAVAAESWLRAQAARGPAPASYAAGRLAAREAHTQKKLRKRSRAVLAKLDSKKQHGWF